MFYFNLVQTPRECASCGTLVTARLAGHYYQDPLCNSCFRDAEPALAEAVLELQPRTSIQLLDTRLWDRCVNCGDDLADRRFTGHHFGDPLCIVCFAQHAPEMAALLMLDQAAIQAADGGRDAPGLLRVAVKYLQLLHRLDAKRPRRALAAQRRSSHKT